MLIGFGNGVGERTLGIAEQVEHVGLCGILTMTGQRLNDGLCRKPLVHEQWQGGSVERQPLSFASPVQQWTA